jgi:hypothetical protein
MHLYCIATVAVLAATSLASTVSRTSLGQLETLTVSTSHNVIYQRADHISELITSAKTPSFFPTTNNAATR